ncbi:MAG: rhomboid family intramembrane serine protease [Pseudomonadota bacterium]
MTIAPTQAGARKPVLSLALVLAIVLGWCWSAHVLQLPFFASQKSLLLMGVGAVDGAALQRGEWWRLLASQFLHVHSLHMMFNLAASALLASAIERRCGPAPLALAFIGGGTLGQLASVLLRPDLVSSGASQAMLALCAFVLVAYRRCALARHALVAALLVTAIQGGLDVAVSGSIKPGHGFGFAAGALIAMAWMRHASSRARLNLTKG